MFYKQCKLRKETEASITILVTYLPEKFAKTNNYVKLKKSSSWENGWLVEKVYKERVTEDVINLRETAYRTHREVTDI